MVRPLYQVDAFTTERFRGNPAAVCLLDAPADESWMQAVAAEMNLSETAFVDRVQDAWSLRWFTPTTEIDLCGHATLASAHVLWTEGMVQTEGDIVFHTRSGALTCRRTGARITMDFPVWEAEAIPEPDGLAGALGVRAMWTGRSKVGVVVEAATADEVVTASPDFRALAPIAAEVLLTARATRPEHHVVCRYFAPGFGIDEDPVTGAAHCTLAPYWIPRLGVDELVSFQASARGGVVRVRMEGDRVRITGEAVTVLRGELIA